jgi:hypothetical protein
MKNKQINSTIKNRKSFFLLNESPLFIKGTRDFKYDIKAF